MVVKGDLVGDVLVEVEGDVVGVGGEILVDFDFEFVVVGIEEGNGIVGGVECGDDF